jgi:host factor-I protein
MDAESGNLQNEFFNSARRERKMVTIFLGNGKKLTGRIKSFDKFTILLDGQQGEQMIFKHAISTVSLSRIPSGDREGAAPQQAAHEASKA